MNLSDCRRYSVNRPLLLSYTRCFPPGCSLVFRMLLCIFPVALLRSDEKPVIDSCRLCTGRHTTGNRISVVLVHPSFGKRCFVMQVCFRYFKIAIHFRSSPDYILEKYSFPFPLLFTTVGLPLQQRVVVWSLPSENVTDGSAIFFQKSFHHLFISLRGNVTSLSS